MEWPKLKNIVLLMLVITNLFLLVFAVGRRGQELRQETQARASAIRLLTGKGIALEDEQVPQKIDRPVLRLTMDRGQERAQALALLGEGAAQEVLGGQVYRYSSDRGAIRFHSGGEFYAQLDPAASPLEGRPMAQHAAEIMAGLGFSGEVISTSSQEEGEGVVVLRQWFRGVPVLDCTATVTYRDGGLYSISGQRRLTGKADQEEGETISVATALIHISTGISRLGDVCSAIHTIDDAYLTGSALGGAIRLVPVWQIGTDTGSYLLDLTTGELTRA